MPKPSEQTNFSRLRSIFFFGLIALLLVGFLYIIRPFFLSDILGGHYCHFILPDSQNFVTDKNSRV